MKRLALLLSLAACGPEKAPGDSADDSTSDATDASASAPLTGSDPTVPGTAGNESTATSADPTDPTSPDPTNIPTTVGDDSTDDATSVDPTHGGDESQVPPVTGKDDMRAWLAAGHYKSWHCQQASHDPLPISPHGKNRICSNPTLSGHGDGEYPVDSASVKELYDDSGQTVVGYAVSRHVTAGTDGGTWYWYEEVPQDSPAPHDADGIVADGPGDSGPAQSICVGCHQATGLDADHPGHDFVYVQAP